MTTTQEPLDFGKALRFFFEDPRWVNKIVVGSLFTLLSFFFIGGFFVAGYVVRVLRRSAAGEEHPLPEWDDLGGIFADGARAIAVYLGHIVPLVLLLTLLGLAAGGAAASSHDAPDALRMVAVLVMIAGYVVLTFVSVALLLYLPAAILRFVTHDRVAAAFDFRENYLFIKRNVGNYALALVTFLAASFLSQFGIILFCIGILPATFWSSTVFGYVMGAVARRDLAPSATADKTPPTPHGEAPKGASYTDFLP
jgi:Protein of unknown function (DUF4013)